MTTNVPSTADLHRYVDDIDTALTVRANHIARLVALAQSLEVFSNVATMHIRQYVIKRELGDELYAMAETEIRRVAKHAPILSDTTDWCAEPLDTKGRMWHEGRIAQRDSTVAGYFRHSSYFYQSHIVSDRTYPEYQTVK